MKITIASLLSVLFAFPLLTLAHGVGFASLSEETDEGYFVDFGYQEDTLIEDTATRFTFELYDEPGTTTMSSFTEVWVVVKGEEGTIYSGGVDRPEFGETGITFTFPNAGNYTVALRYQENSAILANAEFPLTVPESQRNEKGGSMTPLFIVAIIGLVVGFLLGRVLPKRD